MLKDFLFFVISATAVVASVKYLLIIGIGNLSAVFNM